RIMPPCLTRRHGSDAQGDRGDLPHREGQAHRRPGPRRSRRRSRGELAQDALVVAMFEWPKVGVPANPGAWLVTTAKRRAIDVLRRDQMRVRKHDQIARELEGAVDDTAEEIEAVIDDDIGDELLGLIFTACHPMLSADARVA